MNRIEDKNVIKANRSSQDKKEYLHPVFGDKVPYLEAARFPTPWTRTPNEFPSMPAYRQAWKEHRESQPWLISILDPYHFAQACTYLVGDDTKLRYVLAQLEKDTLDRAEDLLACHEWLGEAHDATASFKKFSGAVRRCDMKYSHAVTILYDELFHGSVGGKPRSRRLLNDSQLLAVQTVEKRFCDEVTKRDVKDAVMGERILRAATRLARKSTATATGVIPKT